MSQIEVQDTVDAPLADVWSALADFGGIHKFHPGVERSPIINGTREGIGAQRTCHFYDGNSIDEEVVEFTAGESMVVGVLNGPIPANDIRATFSVEALGKTKTRVRLQMDYRPKFGPVGYLMNRFMLKPKMSQLLSKVLSGLATHVETGALIGKNGQAMDALAA